jgi:hypothetical protein
MRLLTVFASLLALCSVSLNAQVVYIVEDFSSGSSSSIDASEASGTFNSKWGFYQVPEHPLSIGVPDFGSDNALIFDMSSNEDNNDLVGFYSLNSYPRTSSAGPLRVSVDLYMEQHSTVNVTWVSDDGGVFDHKDAKYNLHPSGDNLFCLVWENWRDGGSYGGTWAPGISIPNYYSPTTWITVRMTLNDPVGCKFEYWDGSDWVVLRDETATGDPSANYRFNLALRPNGAGNQVGIDNIVIQYGDTVPVALSEFVVE